MSLFYWNASNQSKIKKSQRLAIITIVSSNNTNIKTDRERVIYWYKGERPTPIEIEIFIMARLFVIPFTEKEQF